MKVESYKYPKSAFLSVEKDTGIIVDLIMKNQNLKKLLHYTSPDCLDRKNLTEDETYELFGKNIKIVPKLTVDGTVLNYIIISYDNFTTNMTNPEFRNNILEIDIICHFDQWHLKDFELRPYRIAAEIDSMLDHKRLTGIGETQFLGASQLILTDEFAGVCLMYQVVHGEEDKKFMPNPADEEQFQNNFNEMFNE
jgi:hypothetical protein